MHRRVGGSVIRRTPGALDALTVGDTRRAAAARRRGDGEGRTGLSDATLKKHIRELERAGFIRRQQRFTKAGDFGSNFYHLEGLIHKLKNWCPALTGSVRSTGKAVGLPNDRNAAAKSKA